MSSLVEFVPHNPLWCEKNYFHPAISQWNDDKLIITLQNISGNDVFGPLEWAHSCDQGQTWSSPEPIPSLGLKQHQPEVTEGIADVRPFFHPQTGQIIAIGCNTHYSSGKVMIRKFPQHPVYSVLSPNGEWSARKILKIDSLPNGISDYRVACAQLIILPDGDLLVPIYLQDLQCAGRYAVMSARCSFDGESLNVKSTGNILTHTCKRGFLEPSLATINGIFYMTIRAEDDLAYFAESRDGVNWSEPQKWRWDNGDDLKTSTTQQHWLKMNDSLFLIYTRETEDNKNVIRWRSPLFISKFNHKTGTLERETEQLVFPTKDRDDVSNLLGNFHACEVGDGKGMISVGSWWPLSPYYSEVWISDVALS